MIYLGKLSLHDLVEPQPRRIQEYIGIANYLENLGDVVETAFVPSGYKRLRQDKAIDQDTCLLLEPLNLAATEALSAALRAFAEDDPVQARTLVDSKELFNRDAEAVRLRMARRLTTDGREGLSTYRLTIEQVENLKRVHTLARRVVGLVIDALEDINSPREAEARLASEASATPSQDGPSV